MGRRFDDVSDGDDGSDRDRALQEELAHLEEEQLRFMRARSDLMDRCADLEANLERVVRERDEARRTCGLVGALHEAEEAAERELHDGNDMALPLKEVVERQVRKQYDETNTRITDVMEEVRTLQTKLRHEQSKVKEGQRACEEMRHRERVLDNQIERLIEDRNMAIASGLQLQEAFENMQGAIDSYRMQRMDSSHRHSQAGPEGLSMGEQLSDGAETLGDLNLERTSTEVDRHRSSAVRSARSGASLGRQLSVKFSPMEGDDDSSSEDELNIAVQRIKSTSEPFKLLKEQSVSSSATPEAARAASDSPVGASAGLRRQESFAAISAQARLREEEEAMASPKLARQLSRAKSWRSEDRVQAVSSKLKAVTEVIHKVSTPKEHEKLFKKSPSRPEDFLARLQEDYDETLRERALTETVDTIEANKSSEPGTTLDTKPPGVNDNDGSNNSNTHDNSNTTNHIDDNTSTNITTSSNANDTIIGNTNNTNKTESAHPVAEHVLDNNSNEPSVFGSTNVNAESPDQQESRQTSEATTSSPATAAAAAPPPSPAAEAVSAPAALAVAAPAAAQVTVAAATEAAIAPGTATATATTSHDNQPREASPSKGGQNHSGSLNEVHLRVLFPKLREQLEEFERRLRSISEMVKSRPANAKLAATATATAKAKIGNATIAGTSEEIGTELPMQLGGDGEDDEDDGGNRSGEASVSAAFTTRSAAFSASMGSGLRPDDLDVGCRVQVTTTIVSKLSADVSKHFELPAGLLGVVATVEAGGFDVEWDGFGTKHLLYKDLFRLEILERDVLPWQEVGEKKLTAEAVSGAANQRSFWRAASSVSLATTASRATTASESVLNAAELEEYYFEVGKLYEVVHEVHLWRSADDGEDETTNIGLVPPTSMAMALDVQGGRETGLQSCEARVRVRILSSPTVPFIEGWMIPPRAGEGIPLRRLDPLLCPEGHRLSPETMTRNSFCGQCHKRVRRAMHVMYCQACRWQLCEKCHPRCIS
mmetsp:Transcript_13801/g.30410  ORF Transcript_13801/g.30410 Transcript_13801/m.30410 type:complete len:997 (+) Transcript_13801:373-3363(+)